MIGLVMDTVFDDAVLAARCRRAFEDAVGALGDGIREDCEIYVPYDTGELCRSVSRGTVTAAEGSIGCDIIWSAPHASAVYYGDERGVRFHTEHHVHARARWFEGAAASCRDAWTEGVRSQVRAVFGA